MARIISLLCVWILLFISGLFLGALMLAIPLGYLSLLIDTALFKSDSFLVRAGVVAFAITFATSLIVRAARHGQGAQRGPNGLPGRPNGRVADGFVVNSSVSDMRLL
ncbi:MAG TPA: hypothetical protein VEQ85_07110 [Lacipirellulaceae bacterium]|nr:hypothetical protein [Lacipirellulaceae bacterium]